jgi:uncharacterized BrkB/YihY/UPF0761 family membrane protein
MLGTLLVILIILLILGVPSWPYWRGPEGNPPAWGWYPAGGLITIILLLLILRAFGLL